MQQRGSFLMKEVKHVLCSIQLNLFLRDLVAASRRREFAT